MESLVHGVMLGIQDHRILRIGILVRAAAKEAGAHFEDPSGIWTCKDDTLQHMKSMSFVLRQKQMNLCHYKFWFNKMWVASTSAW